MFYFLICDNDFYDFCIYGSFDRVQQCSYYGLSEVRVPAGCVAHVGGK